MTKMTVMIKKKISKTENLNNFNDFVGNAQPFNNLNKPRLHLLVHNDVINIKR